MIVKCYVFGTIILHKAQTATITIHSFQNVQLSYFLICSFVIVYTYYHTAGKADAGETWRDVFPDTDAALPYILSSSQLHEKQRNSNQQEQHHIQQQECSCKKKKDRQEK